MLEQLAANVQYKPQLSHSVAGLFPGWMFNTNTFLLTYFDILRISACHSRFNHSGTVGAYICTLSSWLPIVGDTFV